MVSDFGWASVFGQFPGSNAVDLATITLEKIGENADVYLKFNSSAAGAERVNDNSRPLELTEFEISENSGNSQVLATVDNGYSEGASYSIVDKTVYSGGDDVAPADPVAPAQQADTQHVYISDSQFSDDGSQLTVTF